MRYSKMKTLKKSVDAPAFVVGLSYIAILLLKKNGVEVTEELTMAIGSAATGLYGLYKGIMNYIKHRKK